MTLKHITFLTLVFSIILASCGPKAKWVEIKNEEGTTLERYQLIQDSIRHGIYESFYEEGSIFERSEYVQGILHGDRTIYFPDGTPEIEEEYVGGIIHGDYTTYYNNGSINVKGNFKDGSLQGIVSKYFQTGELMEEVSFENNRENGPFKEYYKTGQVKWAGNYINGDNEVGELDSFSLNGELAKKMMCGKFMGQYICQTIWTPSEGDVELKLEFDAE